MTAFNNTVADEYAKISRHYEDWFTIPWPEPVRREGDGLNAVLREACGAAGPLRILDLTCGMGTQAIGLALHGHRVTGMDISAGQLARAREEEAALLGRTDQITWVEGDAAQPETFVNGPFDAVISFANSLPLLGSRTAIETSMAGAFSLLKPGGHVLVSMRDHTDLRARQPHLVESGPVAQADRRGVWLETAEWLDDGRRYISHIMFIYTQPVYEAFHYPFPPLDAITQDEFMGVLAGTGFENGHVYKGAAEAAFPCPVYIARKPGA